MRSLLCSMLGTVGLAASAPGQQPMPVMMNFGNVLLCEQMLTPIAAPIVCIWGGERGEFRMQIEAEQGGISQKVHDQLVTVHGTVSLAIVSCQVQLISSKEPATIRVIADGEVVTEYQVFFMPSAGGQPKIAFGQEAVYRGNGV